MSDDTLEQQQSDQHRPRRRPVGGTRGAIRDEAVPPRIDCGPDAPTSDAAPDVDLSAFGDQHVVLMQVRTRAGGLGSIPPRTQHLMVWANSGPATVTGPDLAAHRVTGVPVMLSAAGAYDFTVGVARLGMVRIDDAFLRTVVADRGHHVVGNAPLRFRQAADAGAIGSLRELLTDIGPLLGDDQVAGLLRTRLDRRLAEAVLDAFPVDPVPSSAADGSRIDRAEAFLREHAREPIGTEDVARSVGLSTRTLQQLFQRERHRPPREVLADVRFDGARHELLTSDPGTTTVSAVARSWRLHHAGRFAIEYHDRFGEHPSDTLRRS